MSPFVTMMELWKGVFEDRKRKFLDGISCLGCTEAFDSIMANRLGIASQNWWFWGDVCVCVCVTVNHRWKIIHKEALNFKPSCFTIPSSPSNQILLSNITVCMSTNRASSDSQSLRHCLFIPTDDIQTSYTTQTNEAYASWTSSSPTPHVSEYISTCLLLAKHKETATWWNPFQGTSFDTKKKRKETSAKIKHKRSLSTTALRLRTLKLTKPSPSVAHNGLAGFWIRDPRSRAVTQDCLFCTADSKITVLLHVHNLFLFCLSETLLCLL